MLSALEIRVEQSEDAHGISVVNERAFGRAAEARLVECIRKSKAWLPALSLVAVLDEQIVAHVLCSRMKIESSGGDFECLALGPVSVIPEYQNKGIGTELIITGIECARAIGWKAVIALGHPDYYSRFGFRPASEFGISPTFPKVQPGAFMALELVEGALANCSAGKAIYADCFSAVD